MKRTLIAAVLAAAVVSGCGTTSSARKPLDVVLDFFPNADHSGIYSAQADGSFARAGLDVRLHAPSDPSTPLKLLAAGRTDLAISYEPEVLRARANGLRVRAVAALVRVPLTSIVSLARSGIRMPADLRGKRVATAGIDYQSAYLTAILARAGVPRSSVHELNVGFDLVPALLAGRADAVLGAYWNYEAIQLRLERKQTSVLRIEDAGVPTYDELVVVASDDMLRHRSALVRRFLGALARGTRDLSSTSGRARALNALQRANPDLDRRLQGASLAATLPYLLPAPGRPYGYMDRGHWGAFTAFMQRSAILSPRVRASEAFTDALLP